MGHSNVRIKVRRRRVAHLAAYSRQFTTKNCTIPKADKNDIIDIKYPWGTVKGTKGGGWTIPKEGYPQPEHLHHAHKGEKWIKFKDGSSKLVSWKYKSQHKDDTEYQKMLWKNLGKAAKMKAYEDEKVKKWERKHPKPCPDDDLFKDEMIPVWEHEREQAIERIRDFVVSMFDKLPLTGRYKESDSKFVEKPVTELKDVNGDGHRVNDLDSKSKLLNKAQKLTNDEKAKNAKLVATNLKDHKRKKGRIILPKAA